MSPLSVGIIGTGFGARVHVPLLMRHRDFQVAAISSMRPDKAEAEAARHQIPQAYSNWRTMLAEARLDVVVIASSPDKHAEMTLEALHSGINVLCEKPPALHASELAEMELLSKAKGAIAAFNFEWRYLPQRQKISQLLTHNELGELFHIQWSEAWSLWPQLHEETSPWERDPSKGGGMLGAVGSHMIDALLHWLGPVQDIHGFTTQSVPALHSPQRTGGMGTDRADDSFFLHGRFERGCSFSLQFVTVAAGISPRIEIFGTKGTLILEKENLFLLLPGQNERKEIYNPPASTSDISSLPREIQPYALPQWSLYSDLASAIAGGPSGILPVIQDAAKVQAILDHFRHS